MARKVSEIALELADREAIRDCLMRYPRAVDRNDLDIFPGYCWPDAIEKHAGVFEGPMLEFFQKVHDIEQKVEVTQHFYGNMLIEIDGSVARTETYVFVYQGHNNEGAKSTFLAGGRSLGTLEKRDDEWRVIARSLLVDWVKIVPDTIDLLEDPLAHKINGARKPDDLSMGHFKKIFAPS
jgi:hypothetical protein